MTSRFDTCLAFTLQWEGGNVDDPLDRGGRTSRGVTQRRFDEYRRGMGLPLTDVWEALDAEIKDIYFRHYWTTTGCGALPEPLDLCVFDSAVNSGPKRAIRWLQTALGMESGEVDGVAGPHTLLNVQDAIVADEIGNVVERYNGIREAHYNAIVQRDPSQGRFIRGWMNRLAAVDKETRMA